MVKTLMLKNIIANAFGQFVYPILSILFTPLFIYYLGLEGYGLVGFFSMLVTLLGVFGDGLGSALQREFARRSADQSMNSRPLLSTFEIVYGCIGCIIGLTLGLVSGVIDVKLLNTETISTEIIRLCLIIISVSIAIRFPLSVYQSTLNGLQEQVTANVLNSVFAVTQAVFGLVVVIVWKSVVAFYVSGLFVTSLQILVTRHWAYRIVRAPDASVTIFVWKELQDLLGISVDLIWTNGLGLLISQIDRLMITWLLPLSALGIYTITLTGARLFTYFYGPFLVAAYPDLCQQARHDRDESFTRLVIRNAKIVMSLGSAVGITCSFFARDILMAWTRNEVAVAQGSLPLSICLIGNILISYSSVFYHGLLALGKSRYAVWFNSLAIFWYPLLMFLGVKHFGLAGAALSWLVYGFLSWVFNLVVFFRTGFKSHLVTYLKVFIATTIVGVFLAFVMKYTASFFFSNQVWVRIFLGAVGGSTTMVFSMFIAFGKNSLKEIMQLFRRTVSRA